MSEQNGLPDGWELTTLDKVVSPLRINVHPADRPELPYIGMEHVEAETMRLVGTGSTGEMKSNARLFRPGDVLYGRLRPYLNKVYRPNFEGLCSAEFIVFPESPGVDNRYLQYFLNSWSFKTFASHLNMGDRPRVDWDQLKGCEFPLPPLSEQHHIVETIEQQLSRLDAGVSALKRVRGNLKRYRAAVLKAAVEGRLTEEWRTKNPDVEPASKLLECILAERRARWEKEQLTEYEKKAKKPPRDWRSKYKEPAKPNLENPLELPEGWRWVSIDQLAYVIGGVTKNQERASLPLRLPYLRVANVYADELRLDNVQEIGVREHELDRVLLEEGDLLVVEGNGSPDQIGRVALWDGSIAPCVHQNHLIKVRFFTRPLERYVLHWLLSVEGRRHIQRVASSTSGLHTLSISKVQALPVPLPPVAEQQTIMQEIERRMSVLKEARAEVDNNLKRTSKLRQSILKQAFEGKLVPQDPSDEPASELLERIMREREQWKKYKKNRRNDGGKGADPSGFVGHAGTLF